MKAVIPSTIIILFALLSNAKEADRKPNQVKESAVRIWCSQNYMTSKKTVFSKDLTKKDGYFETEIAFSEKWGVKIEYTGGQLTYRTKIEGEGNEVVIRGEGLKSALTIFSDNAYGLSCSVSKKAITE